MIANEDKIMNYIYQERVAFKKNATKKDTTLSYVLKVEMLEGVGEFGVRRCKIDDPNHRIGCALNSSKELET